MWTRRTAFIASIPLFIIVASSMTMAGAEPLFSASPGEFTVRNAPPMGKPWTIPESIVVWNRDNVPRIAFVSVEVPPENMVSPGYEPIPNENWVRPYPSSVEIEENSFALIDISLDIPRWENLTGQKWEVWIPVERQPQPGEIGVLRPTVRMKIETAEELPAEGTESTKYLVIAVGVVSVTVALGLLVWSRRR